MAAIGEKPKPLVQIGPVIDSATVFRLVTQNFDHERDLCLFNVSELKTWEPSLVSGNSHHFLHWLAKIAWNLETIDSYRPRLGRIQSKGKHIQTQGQYAPIVPKSKAVLLRHNNSRLRYLNQMIQNTIPGG